jgi:hypothetical protein
MANLCMYNMCNVASNSQRPLELKVIAITIIFSLLCAFVLFSKQLPAGAVQSNPTIKETTSTAVNSSSPQVLPIQIIAQNVQNSTGNWLLFYASDDGKQDPAIARAKLFDISKVPDHSPVSYKINLASDHISKGTTIRACVISMDDPIDLASIHCNKQVFNGTSNQPLPFLIHLPNR